VICLSSIGARLEDGGAPGMKKWGFLWGGTGAWYDGLQQTYEEMPVSWTTPGTRSQQFTSTQDAGLNPFISAVTTTLNPGQSYKKVSKVEQSLDTYGWGNVRWTKLYNYGDLVNPAWTYTSHCHRLF